MLKDANHSYGLISRIFHWLISVMIIIMLIVGYNMTGMESSPQKWQTYNLHKATGVLILFLVVLRFIWRLLNPSFLLPADLPSWQKRAAKANFIMLYIMMFLMPLTGTLMSLIGGHKIDFYGIFSLEAITNAPEAAKIFWVVHIYSSYFFVGIIALHISAALYHHFIRRDNVLMGMLKSNTLIDQ